MKTTFESQQFQPSFVQRLAYEKALNDWLRDYEFKYFYTLTFRSDVSVHKARETLDHFAQRLSRRAFGDSWKSPDFPMNRVSLVAGLERQASSRLHWHVAMQPMNHSHRLSSVVLVELAVRECWTASGGSSQQLDFQVINKNEDNKVVSYSMKQVKYDTDTFYEEWFSRQ